MNTQLVPPRTSPTQVGRLVALVLACFVAGACALLSPYDPTSYENATNLKAESLIVLESATEAFAEHETEVEQLRVRLRQAYEYERGKGSNEETAEQWETLISEEGFLLGGTLKRWKTSGTLTAEFLQEILPKIAAGFDEIIALEQGKVKQ